MKTHNQKIGDIMKLGFSKKTLSLMTESQVNALHKRLVNEETTKTTTQKIYTPQEIKSKGSIPGGSSVALDANNNVVVTKEGELGETKKKTTKKNPWAICTSSLSDEFGTSERSEWTKGQMKKYERCVKGVKKTIEEGRNPYEFLIEQKMSEIVEKHLSPKISKKDLMEAIRMKKLNEQPAPAKPATKPKPGVKPDTDFDPFISPDPDDQPEANSPEPITKPKPGTKPAPTTDPNFDPFISPDPDDQPEASSKGLDWFISKVKNAGLIKKKRK